MKQSMGVKRIKVVDQVYELMSSMILDGTLPPGSRIDYSELENEFQTSRVPIREATQRLVSEGLLKINPRGGTFVISLRQKDIIYLFRLRIFMEMEAVREGFDKIDRNKILKLKNAFIKEAEDIHQNKSYKTSSSIYDTDLALHQEIVLEATDNEIVHHIIGIIYNYAHLAQKMNIRTNSSNQEHLNIVDAILDNDKVETLKALKTHLSQVEKSIIQNIDSNIEAPE